MIKQSEYELIELVERSQRGDKEALPTLAETIYEPLRSYVFRITLSEDITDDVVQETIIEMYKIFGQLKQSDRFWTWLCKIALNKIRSRSSKTTRRKHLLKEHVKELSIKDHDLEGVASLINDEIRQAILDAMAKLTYQQKAVISMRCYEDMSYAQISDVIGVSELSGRIMFFRARKKLQKYLASSGFGRKSLLAVLVIFGKMTAPSEAVAAQVSVASSTLGVGALATTIAVVTTKAALTVTAGGAIALGLASNVSLDNDNTLDQANPNQTYVAVGENSISNDPSETDGNYYYPQGTQGPVMMRMSVTNGKDSYKVLQNDNGNYTYGMGRNVTLRNHHYWNPDLSVMLLPTDSSQLESFLSQVENRKPYHRNNVTSNRNILVAASKNEATNAITYAVQNYNALTEERFQFDWPANTPVEDDRDILHQQGSCFFVLKGELNGRAIRGLGQIPFKYPVSKISPQWLSISIEDGPDIVDNIDKAVVKDASGSAKKYPGGTFLTGLNRPWMGLHCVDTIRRDAALNGIMFKTELSESDNKCRVILNLETGSIEYTVDMHKDLIEKISFLDSNGNPCGKIDFKYLDVIPAGYDNFRRTASIKRIGSVTQETGHWLAELVSGDL